MDFLITYPSFLENITDTFKDLIDEFDLELLKLREGCYLLTGLKCSLRFNYDRGDIFCDFKQVTDYQDSPGYPVWAVHKFLYPLKQDLGKRIYDAKLQLEQNSRMVNDLKNVLEGDFSWLADFLQQQESEKKLFSFVMGMERTNPILRKFLSGDNSWRQDVERYLNEKSINL